MISAGIGGTVVKECTWVGLGLAHALSGAAVSPTSTTGDSGTTAGVASQYGVVSLVLFVLVAVVILYLWSRLRTGAGDPGG